MQKPANQDSRETQPKSTVDDLIVRRIAHALCADKIIEIKPVGDDEWR